jgi:hypothetical protein
MICEIIRNDPRHITMPKLFPDRIGEKVVFVDKGISEYVWCHDYKSVTHRINNAGRRVVEHDPACITSPYRIDDLRPTGVMYKR